MTQGLPQSCGASPDKALLVRITESQEGLKSRKEMREARRLIILPNMLILQMERFTWRQERDLGEYRQV